LRKEIVKEMKRIEKKKIKTSNFDQKTLIKCKKKVTNRELKI